MVLHTLFFQVSLTMIIRPSQSVLKDVSLATVVPPHFLSSKYSTGMEGALGWRILAAHTRVVEEQNIMLFAHPAVCVLAWEVYPNMTCFDETKCLKTKHSLPLINCIFDVIFSVTKSKYLLYVNGDVLVREDFCRAFRYVAGTLNDFLLVSQRIDLKTESYSNERDLQSFLAHTPPNVLAGLSKLHSPAGIDFFCFSVSSKPTSVFPPFLVGNVLWDNWFLGAFLKENNVSVIDITAGEYLYHLGWTNKESHFRGKQTRYNRKVWSQSSGMVKFATIEQSKYTLQIENRQGNFSLSPNRRQEFLSRRQKGLKEVKKLENRRGFHS
mmetsp:Transcript_10651/g.65670  ORF Transcript_10651/g.65670 Transcript_10651/m.65670 type:complete len:325 (-) Transcript_10651:901-1875(-)